MKICQITESSPLTVQGSFSSDLIASKIHLCDKIKEVLSKFQICQLSTIYILGSWYGNLSLLLNSKQIPFEKIINVDIDKNYNAVAQSFFPKNKIEFMTKDANRLNYRQLGSKGLVVNTSCNDIFGTAWFDNIPDGTLVALQARDSVESATKFHSLKSFIEKYPMSFLLDLDEICLQDVETNYKRFTVIGIKKCYKKFWMNVFV